MRNTTQEPRGRACGTAFVKDSWRAWLHAWKPFLSILIISMLGVAVLTGIYAGCRDTFLAADRFYDQQGLHDVQVLSTMGLTDDDVQALKGVDGVSDVQAERTQNVQIDVDGGRKTATIRQIGGEGIDEPYLQEGAMPTKAGQVAVTRAFLDDTGYRLDDTITVNPTDQASDGDAGQRAPEFPTRLTITGVVLDPEDLTNPDGYSKSVFRSSAASDYTLFAPADGVTGDLYTAISLRVAGAQALDTFSANYDDLVSSVTTRIERQVQSKQEQARHDALVSDAQRQLDEAKRKADDRFDAAQRTIDAERAQLEAQTGRMSAAAQAALPQAQLAQAQSRLEAGRAQIDQAQSDLDARRKQADEEFAERQRAIDVIGTPRWYVQTRSALGGFSSLKSDISSIQSLGKAFPVVFLIVAVMMSLTTISRLVEEDRGLIGTYLGLGYGRVPIALRYVLFALLACLLGGGLGLLIGFLGIPAFLLVVIKGLYVVPDLRLEYDWTVGSLGVLLFVVGVLAATLAASIHEMRQLPAALMRPRAPKAGSRILLERIRPLWRRMSFLNKVTARNIFRFKSRLIMTVGGVAGCTALIVCGLAINDTVAVLGQHQFRGVDQYDMLVVANDGEAKRLRDQVDSDGRTTAIMDAHIENAELTNGEGRGTTVQLNVIPERQLATLNEMLDLHPAQSDSLFGWAHAADRGRTVTLGDDGVIVAQSAAQSLGIRDGQDVTVRGDGTAPAKVKVSAVTRGLIGSDVYISEDLYHRLFPASDGETDGDASALTWNAIYAKLKGSDAEQQAYVRQLEDDAAVMSAVSCAEQAEHFKFDLMGAVVALIVGLAGSLALVVLFTLAHTNVSERVREMATLKVLGFYDKEVHRYIDREMIVMTLMGIVIGLPLGRWVAGLLTRALNMPSIYFEVTVSPWSYAIAAGATLFFALLVQWFVNPVLDRIDPVSSLKSVE